MLTTFSLLTGGALGGAAWATWLADSKPDPVIFRVESPATPAPKAEVAAEPKCPAPPPPPPAVPVQIVTVPETPEKRFGPGSCPGREAPSDPALGAPWGRFDDSDRILDNQEFVGVAASPTRHGYLAAWSEAAVYFSDSDGRRFRRVLDGPGTVYDVAVDCRGAVFALRGNESGFMLGYASAKEQWWRPVNMRDTELVRNDDGDVVERGDAEVSLIAGGGWLAVTAPPGWFSLTRESSRMAIAATRDGGVTWSFPSLPDEGLIENLAVFSIDNRSRLRMLGFEGDCMYDGTAMHTIELTGGRAVAKTQLSTARQTHAAVASRWAYDTDSCDAGVCALDLRSKPSDESGYMEVNWRPVKGLPEPDMTGTSDGDQPGEELPAGIYVNGRVYAHYRRHVLRLRGAVATIVGDRLPEDIGFVTMDSSYRLLGLSKDHKLVRWSRRHGVRHLRGQKIE